MTLDDIDRELRVHLPALTALDGTVKLDLGKAGVLFLDATGDAATLTRDDRDADCVVKTSAANMRKLIEGTLNPVVAVTLRKVRIEGDKELIRKLASLLREDRQAASAAEVGRAASAAEVERAAPAAEDEHAAPAAEDEQAADRQVGDSDTTEDGGVPAADGQTDAPTGDARDTPEAPAEAAAAAPTASAVGGVVLPVHQAVAGRLRLRVFGLKGDRERAARLETLLADRPGIRAASASATTGRILLVFDPARDGDAVLAEARQAVAALEGDPAPRPGGRTSSTTTGAVARRPSPDAIACRPSPNGRAGKPWHAMTARDVLKSLDADGKHGLTAEEAARRLDRFGPNALTEAPERSRLGMLLEQFSSLPVALLGASAVISVATGGLADAVAIAAVLGINATVGYLTESRAERTIRSLTRHGQRTALVRRAGGTAMLPVEAVVPGDLIALSAGMFAAADARLVAATDLTVNESMLTGESLPVRKDAGAIARGTAPIGDRLNMVYKGTVVTGGSGLAVVVATGDATEIGAIRSMVSEADTPETPMQRQLGDMGRLLAYVSGSICIGVLGIGLLRGYGFFPMLKASTALAVAAVPEGLPAVATTTLALGMNAMRRQKVLIRRLEAVETLGSVGVIGFDKTGTLTINRMVATEARTAAATFRRDPAAPGSGRAFEPVPATEGGPEPEVARADLVRLFEIATLCNEAAFADKSGADASDGGTEGATMDGSATETALLHGALAAGVDIAALRRDWPVDHIRRRSEDANVMITYHTGPGGARLAAVKGAPAEVLERCTRIRRAGVIDALSEDDVAAVAASNDAMAAAALRVLGVACGEHDGNDAKTDADGLVWLGLVGMTDPLRPGMRDLMHTFHNAGIRTVMITGDQSATAYAVARELDLNRGRQVRILEATDLEAVAPDLLAALTGQADVFARVSPAHKLRIVRGLQQSGHVVAMTGDGVNDGPALKAADVGVAMGAAGSDVAHELADVVIEDDSIETMAVAVGRGRTIYRNIQKSLHFLLATNLSEVIVVSAGTALGMGQPLTPMQLLWINLVSDIFPGIALSLEPPTPDVLLRPPRDPATPIVGSRDLSRMAAEGAVISAGALAAYGWGVARYGIGAEASSMAFHSLTAAQLLHALSCRSDRHRVFERHRYPPNALLAASVAAPLAATLLATLAPPARRLLGTAPVGPVDWLVTAAAAILPFLVIEGSKPWLIRLGGEDDPPAAASQSATGEERETP